MTWLYLLLGLAIFALLIGLTSAVDFSSDGREG